MMDFIKQNKKQLLVLLVLIVAYLFFRGTDISVETSSNNVSDVTSVVSQQAENEADVDGSADETIAEAIDEETKKDTVDINGSVDEDATEFTDENQVDIKYEFRNNTLWKEHFEKHGEEFPYETKEEYLQGANIMLENPNKLHKLEKEDGDDVYYLEETNEFIIVSKDGYLRTYFKPSKGKKYFDKQ